MKEQKFYITVVDSSTVSNDFEFWGMGESEENVLNDLYPNRDTLYEFCEKHNLLEEAKRDLQGLFYFERTKVKRIIHNISFCMVR